MPAGEVLLKYCELDASKSVHCDDAATVRVALSFIPGDRVEVRSTELNTRS